MATRVSLGGVVELLERVASLQARYALAIFLVIVVASAALGVYLRALAWPKWLRYGVFIDANDPWIEYWTGRYLYEHGLASWWELRPPNPAVMKFWYPWGRDFPRTSYPFVPMLIAAGYSLIGKPLGLTLQQWAALLPPLAGGLLVLVVAWLLYRRYGLLAGVLGAVITALLPASSDRTLLGFIEKEGILLPFVVLSVYLVSRAIDDIDDDRKRLLYSFAAGLAACIVGLGWGGYLYPVFVFAASLLLLPAAGIRPKPRYADMAVAFWVAMLPAMLFSRWGGVRALFVVPGGVILAAGLAVVILAQLYEYVERVRVPARGASRAPVQLLVQLVSRILRGRFAYLVAGITVIVLGFITLAALHALPSRVAFLLLPGGLKSIAVARAGPLVESVAEHNPDIRQLLSEVTPGVVTVALLGLVYLVYRIVVRGVGGDIPVFISVLVGIYAMFNAAYFTQTGGVFAAISAGLVFGVISELSKMRRSEEKVYIAAGVALLALVVVSSVAVAAAQRLPYYAERLPAILTSSTPFMVYAPAWYDALLYIKAHTSNDTVVVSWWDYGYWISVVGDRASLADGATMNKTQISILARILVGPYTEAKRLLRLLHCEPGKTLVIAYGVYHLVLRNDGTLVAALSLSYADIAKSYWMIRIGGFRVEDYLGVVTLPGSNVRIRMIDPQRESVRNAILYRLLFQAPLMLKEEGVVKILAPVVQEMVSNASAVNVGIAVPLGGGRASIVYLRGPAVELLTPPPGFKPYLVSAYPIIVSRVAGQTEALVVIVAAYEWVE